MSLDLEDDDITFIKGGDTRKTTLQPDDLASPREPLVGSSPEMARPAWQRVETEPHEASWIGLGSL